MSPNSGQIHFDRPEHPADAAEALIREGRYAEALSAVDGLLLKQPESTKAMRVRCQALMALRRFDDAVKAIAGALDLQPDNVHYRKLHAIALKDSGIHSEALPLLEALHRETPVDLDIIGALGVAHFRVGNEAEALRYGQLKLDHLVASAGVTPAPTPNGPGAAVTGRNVVSYSLWGDTAQYCEGALLNARRVPEVLPGWSARFYVDQTVPEGVLNGLRDAGAEVVLQTELPAAPLMRRFLVHDDPQVSRYLIRDSDSRIGPRELAAVNAWLESGLGFHVIRDHPFHTELMQGGLWGGTAGRAFRMSDCLQQLHGQSGVDHRYGADQDFLRDYIWPIVREDLLTHDSYYRTPGSRPFPDGSRGSDADHVGMGIVLRD